jgi:uncharacterized protein (TIGR03435 family)
LATATPTFETASIRVSTSRDTDFSAGVEGSQFRARNLPLRSIIAHAYEIGLAFGRPGLEQFRLRGGPDKILNARFDIVANLPSGAAPREIPAMLRELLHERFRLRIHSETRQGPIYQLRVERPGKLGPNLRSSALDCVAYAQKGGTPRASDAPRDTHGRQLCWVEGFDPKMVVVRYAGPIAQLVRGLQPQLDRLVIDATGLQGNYEWDVRFTSGWAKADSDVQSIFTAVREQLGLKLDATTGAIDVFVIDSVEMPSPN